MIMTICASNNRNAIVDGYVGLINHFHNKKELIAIVPGLCKSEEFDPEIHNLVFENFRDKGKVVSKFYCLSFYIRLALLAKQENVDGIFIYSDSEWPNLVHLMIPTLRKINTTVFIHDPKHHSGEQMIIRFIRRFAYPFYARNATCILSYEKAKSEIIKIHPIFKKANLVSVRLPSMSVMEYQDLRQVAELHNTVPEYDLIFYGRLEAYKGVDLLLQANQYLHMTGRAVRILIIGGRGELKEEVKKTAAQDPCITFLDDYISNRALAEYIVKSRAVILPYRDATGTQTIQIANYYYKPVIVNHVGCFDEYVFEGKNGFFISEMTPEGVGEAIHSTLEQMDGLDYNPANIREKFNALFDIDIIAREIEDIIQG